jgi:hypothetical protein
MRSRVSSTISIGPIRLLRRASRNSATVFASTPARRAPRDAVREVVFAALRAFCWRPRACPPFLAAALRFDADELEADERELDPDEREPAVERLRGLEDERLLDPAAFFLPPELPLLRRSAICFPSWVPADWCTGVFPRNRDYLTLRVAVTGA